MNGKTATTEYSGLNPEFSARMRDMLVGDDYAAYIDALNLPPMRTARKNPIKDVPDPLICAELGGFPLLPATAKPGQGALHAAGAYYVQEPAAAAVANLIAPLLPQKATVLDMCAAPGGKVTAAASARPDCVFFANEIVFSRAKILLSNIERMGLRNCTVGSLRPEDISRAGGELFDAVIADVPCSGEGMIRKTSFNADDLSADAVTACARRAAKIADECDKCLSPGGILLFSTCTFNRTENEEQVMRLIREKGYVPISPAVRPPKCREGFGLREAVRFFPQDGGGEGHFACILRKPDDAPQNGARRKTKNPKGNRNPGNKRVDLAISTVSKITAERFDPADIITVGDGVELLPGNYPFGMLPALRRGMRIADFAGDRAIPHHHFATAAAVDMLINSPDYAPGSKEIAAYLSGGEFACDAPDGYRVLRVAGITLGLIKVSGGTAKNHYPKGLRI